MDTAGNTNKDIRQYLHLYLGADVFGSYLDNSGSKGMLTGVTNGGHECEVQFFLEDGINVEEEPVWNDANEIKLILRPLSDMGMTEAVEIYDELFPSVDRNENLKISSIKGFCSKDGMYYEGHVSVLDDAKYVTACLKRGFDLFGLIEAGLAIDKTTLTGNQ